MDLFARAIDAVLQDAKVERATLVGHSMGTPVIRQFYRKYPAKTRALVIVDGSLKPFPNKAAMDKFLEPLRGPNYKPIVEGMVSAMVAPVKDKTTAAEIKTAMLSAPQHVMTGAFDGMLDEAIWKEQDKINVPVLAVMAKQPNWTPEYEKFVHELAPGVEYQVWDGVSHFLMMDEPQKFNDTVAAFLKKNNLIKK
jgi:pimeloyl-ACP methyl ester carboxylesterase